MEFEHTQRVERSQELDAAIRQGIEQKIERRLRDMVDEKLKAWYNSQIERCSDQLQKEADRIFLMVLEGKASGHAIEEEPTKAAKDIASRMELK